MRTAFFALLMVVTLSGRSFSQDADHLALDSPFGSFVEHGFPFFTQTLDARDLGGEWPNDNLTPRGVILKLGGGYFACFDTDLLRVALVWKENQQGEYLTMTGMGPGSYRLPNKKAPAGQKQLPKPIGTPVAAMGIYPGFGEKVDPRERRSADQGEPGVGPAKGMRWKGIKVAITNGVHHGFSLHYEVDGVAIEETWARTKRTLNIAPHSKPIQINWSAKHSSEVAPAEEAVSVSFNYDEATIQRLESPAAPHAFSQSIETGVNKTTQENGYKIEEVGLPLSNPWKRNVRPAAFDFFKNGTVAVVTFDGDVWIVSGLVGDLSSVKWQRFASGMHEPIGLEIVDEQIYVFSRNGIVRPQDTDKDGIADFYENFSNIVPQTSETREFAMDIFAKPEGGFYLAKGGQVASTKGIANGTIVEVAADGQSYEVVCTGMRQPYIGVNYKTGMVTSSDQQGNWKPATPLRIIRKGEYYGFQPAKFKDKAVHPEPYIKPEIWIPHFVNQSGASQVWLHNAKMGSLNDSLIHIGYNRPEIFKIYFDEVDGGIVQGGVVSISHQFASGLLKGRVNPIDGSLYLTGFKIWGTSAEQIGGLYRVTPSGEPVWLPAELKSEKRGVLIRFHQPVDEAIAANLPSYSVDRWNYKRTHNYGSGHYKLNGEPGQESLPVASVKLSKDKQSVFLGIPDMKPSHSLRVTYKVPTSSEMNVANAFLTIHQLNSIDLRKNGFSDDDVNLTLSAEMLTQVKAVDPTAELGKETATKFGCIACHAAGSHVPASTAAGGATVAVGPAWNGLWQSKRKFTDGTELKKVDAVYLKESILDPARKVAKGFEMEKTGVGMPSYLGVLKDHEIDSIILYIQSLHKVKPKKKK